MSANARNYQLILLNYLSGSDVIFEHELVLDQSVCRQLYPLFSQPCSVFELVVFTIEACGICFHDTLTGWTYAFLNMCELESFHESYSSGITPGKTFNTNAFIKGRSEWEVIHWRSGSRPWSLSSCPWTWCGTYHGSFLPIFTHSSNSFGVIKLDPL